MTLLRALLVLALMLNGNGLPPAAATSDAPDAATHVGHQATHHPDQAPADDPADPPTGDCCDGMSCGCGCAGPQLLPLPLAAAPRVWDRTPAVFTLVSAPFAASLIAAPFRPPA